MNRMRGDNPMYKYNFTSPLRSTSKEYTSHPDAPCVMSEKAVMKRKWREVQVPYAQTLHSVLSNHPCYRYLFIRKELVFINKLGLNGYRFCVLLMKCLSIITIDFLNPTTFFIIFLIFCKCCKGHI